MKPSHKWNLFIIAILFLFFTTFNPNQLWEMSCLMLNGWQCMQRLEGNSLTSFGTQVNFSLLEKILGIGTLSLELMIQKQKVACGISTIS